MAAKTPKTPKWVSTPIDEGSTRILDTQISDTFPPTQIYNIDIVQLLQMLSDEASAPEQAMVFNTMRLVIDEAMLDGVESARAERVITQTDEAKLLAREMELVGLIINPSYFGDCPFVRADDLEGKGQVRSTKALGLFSRTTVLDDNSCALRLKVEESVLGKAPVECRWELPQQLDVFAIEGLSETPDLAEGWTEALAEVLLSKIARYARKEQRIVVLSKQAHTSSDGTDLTEYYVRLGFEKVQMENGLELVYTGKRHKQGLQALNVPTLQAEMAHIMIGMDLWSSPSLGDDVD